MQESSIARNSIQDAAEEGCFWARQIYYWQHVVPPMRPVAEDTGFVWEAARNWIREKGAPRVLLLGVTPELYNLPWPEGTDFLAVDRTQPMIDLAWPGPKENVRLMDWRSMQVPDNSRDIVLCDGGLHLLRHPGEQRALVHALGRLISDEGVCAFRLFAPPAKREPVDAVVSDLINGRISNLSILKLRMGMSLRGRPEEGISLSRIFRKISESIPDLQALAAKIGWPTEHLRAIEAYRQGDVRYFPLTVDEACTLFCGDPGGFRIENVRIPTYELGQYCPTLIMRRC